jgi:hypothetical protein
MARGKRRRGKDARPRQPPPDAGALIELERMGNREYGGRHYGRGRTGRSTEAEALLRRLQVRKWLLEGFQRMEIVRFGAELWRLRTRQMEYYIAAAKAEIRDLADAAGLVNQQWHVAARVHLYNKALGAEDLRTALRVVDSLHHLSPDGDGPPRILFEEDHTRMGDDPATSRAERASEAPGSPRAGEKPAAAPAAPREPEPERDGFTPLPRL